MTAPIERFVSLTEEEKARIELFLDAELNRLRAILHRNGIDPVYGPFSAKTEFLQDAIGDVIILIDKLDDAFSDDHSAISPEPLDVLRRIQRGNGCEFSLPKDVADLVSAALAAAS